MPNKPLTVGELQQHAANIDMAVATILDLLKIGAMFYPPLTAAAPAITMFVNFEAHKLKGGLADGTIIADREGGFVTKSWADDPRHQLNQDGSFRFP